MSNLKNKAVNGVFWTTLRSIVSALASPILLILQAQYLTPNEFGTLAIINIFLQIINIIENFGLSTSIVQKDEVNSREISSLFYLQIFTCLILGLLLFTTSGLISTLFEMPALNGLLKLLSFTIVFRGPTIIFTALLEKEFFFKELSIIEIVRQIINLIVVAIMLYSGYGLISIIIGQIISVVFVFFTTLFVTLRNKLFTLKFYFNFRTVRPFLRFGTVVATKQMINQLTQNLDEVIIGIFFTATELGYYHFAKNILNRIRVLISTSFSKVLLPIFSKLKNDAKAINNVYNQINQLFGLIAFPVFTGIALVAEPLVLSIFGSQWLDSIVFIRILSIAFIPYMITANTATSYLYAIDKAEDTLYTDIITSLVYMVILYFVSRYFENLVIVSIIYSAYLIIKTFILQLLVNKYQNDSFIHYLSLFKEIVLSTFIMAISVIFVDYMFRSNSLLELLIMILIGIVAYFISIYIFNRKIIYRFIDLVKGIVK